MADVGLPVDFIDTQDARITNVSDSKAYIQATNVRFYMDAKLTRRQRTDSEFENLWDLLHGAIEADIMVTQPEIAGLVALMPQTNNNPASKNWSISMADEAGTTTTLSGSAQLAKLNFVDEGIGAMKYHIRLEFEQTAVTVA